VRGFELLKLSDLDDSIPVNKHGTVDDVGSGYRQDVPGGE
jgi:hypothetical protein